MTLPAPLAAALDALGLPAPKPQPVKAPHPPVWMPKRPGDEPPF